MVVTNMGIFCSGCSGLKNKSYLTVSNGNNIAFKYGVLKLFNDKALRVQN